MKVPGVPVTPLPAPLVAEPPFEDEELLEVEVLLLEVEVLVVVLRGGVTTDD